MKLYTTILSGHCHRVELLLSFLQIQYERVDLDLMAGQQRDSGFLELNPWGQVPVLVDDEFVIHESNAIMVYIAKKANARNWLPEELRQAAAIQSWLSISSGPLTFGCSRARTIARFGVKGNLDEAQKIGRRLLVTIESVVGDKGFLVGRGPTIADLAMFSYIAASGDAGIGDHVGKRTAGWLLRVEDLPGFFPMRE